jgi:cell division protein FtsB
MDSMELFGLTKEQHSILYSVEYQLVQKDIDDDKKKAAEKAVWLNHWENALNSTQEGSIAIPYKKMEELISAVQTETANNPNKTWLYLSMLEAALFTPYSPLGGDEDRSYQKLHFTDQSEWLKDFVAKTDIMEPEYIDRFRKTYTRTLNQISGKWKKAAIRTLSVVAFAAITAATAGVMAGPIAVAIFGESFAGLSGAALTSACLAMAGGGAIAIGGAGMTGGVAAIAGGGAILGLAGGGAVMNAVAMITKTSPSFAMTMAAKLEVVLKEIILNAQKDIQNAQAVMDAMREQIKALQKELADLKTEQEKDKKTLANMEKSLGYLKKAYKDMAKFKAAFELGMTYDDI